MSSRGNSSTRTSRQRRSATQQHTIHQSSVVRRSVKQTAWEVSTFKEPLERATTALEHVRHSQRELEELCEWFSTFWEQMTLEERQEFWEKSKEYWVDMPADALAQMPWNWRCQMSLRNPLANVPSQLADLCPTCRLPSLPKVSLPTFPKIKLPFIHLPRRGSPRLRRFVTRKARRALNTFHSPLSKLRSFPNKCWSGVVRWSPTLKSTAAIKCATPQEVERFAVLESLHALHTHELRRASQQTELECGKIYRILQALIRELPNGHMVSFEDDVDEDDANDEPTYHDRGEDSQTKLENLAGIHTQCIRALHVRFDAAIHRHETVKSVAEVALVSLEKWLSEGRRLSMEAGNKPSPPTTVKTTRSAAAMKALARLIPRPNVKASAKRLSRCVRTSVRRVKARLELPSLQPVGRAWRSAKRVSQTSLSRCGQVLSRTAAVVPKMTKKVKPSPRLHSLADWCSQIPSQYSTFLCSSLHKLRQAVGPKVESVQNRAHSLQMFAFSELVAEDLHDQKLLESSYRDTQHHVELDELSKRLSLSQDAAEQRNRLQQHFLKAVNADHHHVQTWEDSPSARQPLQYPPQQIEHHHQQHTGISDCCCCYWREAVIQLVLRQQELTAETTQTLLTSLDAHEERHCHHLEHATSFHLTEKKAVIEALKDRSPSFARPSKQVLREDSTRAPEVTPPRRRRRGTGRAGRQQRLSPPL